MTVREWIYGLRVFLEDKSGIPQSTRGLSPKFLYYCISMVKDSLVYGTEQPKRIDRQNPRKQYLLPKIEMERFAYSDITPGEDTTNWMKSKHPLPDFVGRKLEYVTEKQYLGFNENQYAYVESDMFHDLTKSRFSRIAKKNIYTVLQFVGKDYLFSYSPEGRRSKVLAAMGPFVDILQMLKFSDELEKNKCNFLDLEWDIDLKYKILIFTRTKDVILNFMSSNRISDTKADRIDGSLQETDT
jgi:hypothetical protein